MHLRLAEDQVTRARRLMADGDNERAEWFLVRKDLQTGEVRFRIQASWRTGEFPNVISWLGFLMFGLGLWSLWARVLCASKDRWETRSVSFPRVRQDP